ncbi:hypothetical protein [Agrobacterium sp. NPDC089420]|uniref:hypothetical protein n=1 Tax=Agrobacterium sp. NPDC089420 TaxID=3363918 RepID=UPI00384D7763
MRAHAMKRMGATSLYRLHQPTVTTHWLQAIWPSSSTAIRIGVWAVASEHVASPKSAVPLIQRSVPV